MPIDDVEYWGSKIEKDYSKDSVAARADNVLEKIIKGNPEPTNPKSNPKPDEGTKDRSVLEHTEDYDIGDLIHMHKTTKRGQSVPGVSIDQ